VGKRDGVGNKNNAKRDRVKGIDVKANQTYKVK